MPGADGNGGVTRSGRSVARLTLVPDAEGRVALGVPRLEALTAQLDALGQSGECRVVVLDSGGDEFCRGLDLAPALRGSQADLRTGAQLFADCLRRIVGLVQPVVAIVDGPATGGGVGLVASADVAIASERARFQLPELCLGLTPALVAPVAGRRMGPARVRHWALTGRTYRAEEAREAGLVDCVVRASRLDAELRNTLRYLLRARPAAIGALKADFGAAVAGVDGLDALDAAVERTCGALGDASLREELHRFLDGHAPSWFQPLGDVS